MFIAFMFHTTKDHYHTEEAIKLYFSKYLIAYESKPYEHYHVVAEDLSKNAWVNFRQNILIQKLQLRGRATKDLPRQYGKLKNIEDIDKIISYTIKDGEYIKSENFEITDEQIKNSFKKHDKKEAIEDLQLYIKTKTLNTFGNIKDYSEFKLKCQIVDYIRDETNQNPTRHRIEKLFLGLMNLKGTPFEKSSRYIVEYLFPFTEK